MIVKSARKRLNIPIDIVLSDKNGLPYILVYKSNFLDVKMGSKNRPRLIFGRTWDIPTESQKNAKIHCNKPSYGVK